MYRIRASVRIKASPAVVYGVLKRVQEYPDFMKQVRSVKTEHREQDYAVNHWEVAVEDTDICWREKEVANDSAMIRWFELIDGDYDLYTGIWRVRSSGDSTVLSIELKVDWGVASFEEMIREPLLAKTRQMIRGMIVAIKIRSQNKTTGKEV